MKLSILMPALESRPYDRLLDELRQQAAPYPCDVEILHLVDDGSLSSGMKRQTLMNLASGDYLAFVDDDDEVSATYIEELLSVANSFNPDLICFNLKFWRNENPRETWRLGLWTDQRRKGRMTANHLCVWRTELARKVAWDPKLGYGDDQAWYKPLIASGVVDPDRVHRIEAVLYHYRYSDISTANQKKNRIREGKLHVGRGLRCFWREDGEIVIEVGPPQTGHQVRARDRENEIRTYNVSELKHFHTFRLE